MGDVIYLDEYRGARSMADIDPPDPDIEEANKIWNEILKQIQLASEFRDHESLFIVRTLLDRAEEYIVKDWGARPGLSN